MDQNPPPSEVLRVVDALHRRVDTHDRTIVKIETQIEGLDRRFDTQAIALAEMRAGQQLQAQSAARTEEAIAWIKNELNKRVQANEERTEAAEKLVKDAEKAAREAQAKSQDASGKGAWGVLAGTVGLLTVVATTVYELVTR